MSVSPSSSAQQARQALGARLGEIREDTGLTGRALAALCGWHPSKVSKIEHAKTSPSPEDIRAWAEHCDVPEQTADLIASLRTAQGMWVEWRRMERAGLRRAQEERLPLYERTTRFRVYSSWLIPGLIQTRAYTTAVLRAIRERRGLVDDVEAAVASRMERQRLLHTGERRFAFLIEESVLRCGTGGAETMAEQLAHILAISSLANVSVGVVPMQPDRVRWPVESFWMFDMAEVNVELVSGFLTITQPGEIAMYARTFGEFTEHALYGAAARELISSAADSLG
ncbi:helix-turn-helix domain-containing protein [Streptomyces sp. NPDC021098]|uniref:helix-turn-helix domain-containing protein n=1 Tax=unclassified Streptomyces TaxID=2593676 RepID=UPI0037B40065